MNLQQIIDLEEASQALKKAINERGQKIKLATAESLTGGLIASVITMAPGSSSYFDRSFVVYNNEAKEEMLGVNESTIERYTEVSGQCVKEMALGAGVRSHADIAVSVSGVAGPSLGGDGNPVGTVWVGMYMRGKKAVCKCEHFKGDRDEIRACTVLKALSFFKESIESNDYPEGFFD